MKKRQLNWGKVISTVLVFVYLLWVVFPAVWMLGMSFKNPKDVMASPPKFIFQPTLENYEQLFLGKQFSTYTVVRPDFPRGLKNSFIIASGATLLSMVTGTLCAYALARFRFPQRESLAFTILSFRFAPGLGTLLPMYWIYRKLQLYDTYPGLIIVMQMVSLPLLVWVIRSYIESVPVDLEQAALVDGYSWFGAFRKILLPLIAPGIAATAVISFIFCWNNFTYGLILAGRKTMSLTVATMQLVSYEQVLWGQMAAAGIVTILPGMILILLVQRWVVRGLTFGAVKF